jgi:hypothetical protein
LRVNDQPGRAHAGNGGRGERPQETTAIHFWHAEVSIKRPRRFGRWEPDPILCRSFAVRGVIGKLACETPVLLNCAATTAANRTIASTNMSAPLRESQL